jgi:DNA-binding Lrp family transcriptional regulator
MQELDDTDRTILQLLLEDARRSWRDIAETVDLSPPAVADRVDRLQEIGVIRNFTVEVDRSKLGGGTPVLVTLDVTPRAAGAIADDLAEADRVEHVFTTADERVVFTARVLDGDVVGLLESAVVMADIEEFDVELLTDQTWSPSVQNADLALTCAECGNTVTSEGQSREIDGDRYHFCCASCESQFVQMYEDLREGV